MNHYEWLDEHWEAICKEFGVTHYPEAAASHGDKCESYMRTMEEEEGVHPFHTAAMYLLSHQEPFSSQVRDTRDGWVPVVTWLKANKDMADRMPPIEPEDENSAFGLIAVDTLEGWGIIEKWKYIDECWKPVNGLMFEVEQEAIDRAAELQKESPSKVYQVKPWKDIPDFIMEKRGAQ